MSHEDYLAQKLEMLIRLAWSSCYFFHESQNVHESDWETLKRLIVNINELLTRLQEESTSRFTVSSESLELANQINYFAREESRRMVPYQVALRKALLFSPNLVIKS